MKRAENVLPWDEIETAFLPSLKGINTRMSMDDAKSLRKKKSRAKLVLKDIFARASDLQISNPKKRIFLKDRQGRVYIARETMLSAIEGLKAEYSYKSGQNDKAVIAQAVESFIQSASVAQHGTLFPLGSPANPTANHNGRPRKSGLRERRISSGGGVLLFDMSRASIPHDRAVRLHIDKNAPKLGKVLDDLLRIGRRRGLKCDILSRRITTMGAVEKTEVILTTRDKNRLRIFAEFSCDFLNSRGIKGTATCAGLQTDINREKQVRKNRGKTLTSANPNTIRFN